MAGEGSSSDQTERTSVYHPPHPAQIAGAKRSAGNAFTSGRVVVTAAARVAERATVDQTVLRELEVGSNGAVLKRVRL